MAMGKSGVDPAPGKAAPEPGPEVPDDVPATGCPVTAGTPAVVGTDPGRCHGSMAGVPEAATMVHRGAGRGGPRNGLMTTSSGRSHEMGRGTDGLPPWASQTDSRTGW